MEQRRERLAFYLHDLSICKIIWKLNFEMLANDQARVLQTLERQCHLRIRGVNVHNRVLNISKINLIGTSVVEMDNTRDVVD